MPVSVLAAGVSSAQPKPQMNNNFMQQNNFSSNSNDSTSYMSQHQGYAL